MSPDARRAPGRRLVLALVATGIVCAAPTSAPAAPAGGAPDRIVVLTKAQERLAERANRLEHRLDRRRAQLAQARGRLDAARRDYEEALGHVERRVVELYKTGGPEVTEGLVTGGIDGAQARTELARVINRGDAQSLARLRLALTRLDAAQADVETRKGSLAEGVAELEAQRLALDEEIADHGPADTPASAELAGTAPAPAPFTLPITVAASLEMPYTPPRTRRADERGLPSSIVAARSLPGFFAYDPVTKRGDFGTPPSPAPAAAGAAPAAQEQTPATAASFDAVASFGLRNGRMANGERYDPRGLTAAHRTLPLGTWLRVSYGDRIVVVRVTDRGPYVVDRDLDLSEGAAELLGLAGTGTVHADVVTGPAG